MAHNRYSKVVTQDPSQPAAQAMLHAIGLTDDDFEATRWDSKYRIRR